MAVHRRETLLKAIVADQTSSGTTGGATSLKAGIFKSAQAGAQVKVNPVSGAERPNQIKNTKPHDFNFAILNFFEVLQPPPMFPTFKEGFMHFMRTATEHPQFIGALLLKDITGKGRFPYVNYCVFKLRGRGRNFHHDPRWVQAIIEGHGNLQVHHQAAFSILFTYMDSSSKWTPATLVSLRDRMAYIVIVFKADGNFDRLDETWQKWSGADFIAHHLPKEVKVGKMILHKRCAPHGTFMYVLVCELKNGLIYYNLLLDLLERLNERSCGYASLYSIDEIF